MRDFEALLSQGYGNKKQCLGCKMLLDCKALLENVLYIDFYVLFTNMARNTLYNRRHGSGCGQC